jgi:hypothetical protein
VHLKYGLNTLTQALARIPLFSDDLKGRDVASQRPPLSSECCKRGTKGNHQISSHMHMICCRRFPWKNILSRV